MIRLTRARRLGAALAASAIVLTACGGGGDDDSAGDTNTSEESESSAPEGDGTLTLGTLLPQTGDLAFLGPPEFAGVDLAVEDMNAAGGVLGKDVVNVKADSGDGTPDIAGAEVDKLFNQDADAVIGAAASGVSVSVIDKITGAGVVHFSPANTAAGFDTYDDNGLYFRTAPSDRLQGQVLANLAVEDGFSNVAVMARQDFYGEGLAEQVQTTLEEKGATRRRLRPLRRGRAELHRRGQPDRGGQARRPGAGRVRGDHEDHPAADRQGDRPAGHPDLLRGRQPGRLLERELRPDRRQGHAARCPATPTRASTTGCSRSTPS